MRGENFCARREIETESEAAKPAGESAVAPLAVLDSVQRDDDAVRELEHAMNRL